MVAEGREYTELSRGDTISGKYHRLFVCQVTTQDMWKEN